MIMSTLTIVFFLIVILSLSKVWRSKHIFDILLSQDVLRVLLKNNVNVNKPLSASKKKVTPLMLAAQQGFLDMARLLVQSGSKVELTGLS